MLNSIQHFTENGIPQLEEIMKKFMQNPADLNQFVDQVKQVMLEFGCHIVSETLEECNTMLEESVKRKISWQIKDRAERTLLTSLGQLRFSRTRFTHKKAENRVLAGSDAWSVCPYPSQCGCQGEYSEGGCTKQLPEGRGMSA